jgi:hypothetical protein
MLAGTLSNHGFSFTLLTLRPTKILSRKNHTGGGCVRPCSELNNKSSPVRGNIFVEIASQNISKFRQERHIPSVHQTMSLLTELVISMERIATNIPRLRRFAAVASRR